MKAGRRRPARRGTVTVLETARRFLLEQVRLLRALEPEVARGGAEALHDYRVALRRLRVLLRAFRAPLRALGTAPLEGRLRELSKSMGPARDTDVWMKFLRSAQVRRAMSGRPGWNSYVRAERENQASARAALAVLLSTETYRRLLADTEAFLRGPLASAGSRSEPAEPPEDTARRLIRKFLQRVEAHSAIAPGFAPDQVHRLRILCRRARYVAEFFGPFAGQPAVDLGRRLKSVQDVLGDIHDRDVYASHLRARPPPGGTALLRSVARARRTEQVRFRKAWDRLQSRRFRNELDSALR